MVSKTLQYRFNQILSNPEYRDKHAIESGSLAMTYGELDRASDRIARWIKDQGVEDQTFIGVLTHDRFHFITVAIGILKARCVFVPLDPEHPGDRLATMIRSTHIKIVVADDNNRDRMTDPTPGNMDASLAGVKFVITEECLAPKNSSSTPLNTADIPYSPEDKIYIYFTSGTTGEPSAMIGKNKSLLHFINWEIETFGIDNDFRISQLPARGSMLF